MESESRLDVEPASAMPFLNDKKPRPSMISTLKRQNSKRHSRESTKQLSASQFHLIDDKVAHPTENKYKGILVHSKGLGLGERPKARKSKLLDKISLIAAKGANSDDSKAENPAAIFKQVLVLYIE